MKIFRKYTVQNSIPVLAVLCLIVMYIIANRMAIGRVRSGFDSVSNVSIKAVQTSSQVKQDISDLRDEILLSCTTGEEVNEAEIDRLDTAIHTSLDELSASLSEKAADITSLENSVDQFLEVGLSMANTYRVVGRRGGNEKIADFQTSADTMLTEINALNDYVAKLVEDETSVVAGQILMVNATMVGFIIALFVVLILVYVVSTRPTVKDFKEIVETMERLSENDMTVEPLGKSRMEELSALRTGINTLLENLKVVLKALQSASREMSRETQLFTTGSAEISEALGEIADGMGAMSQSNVSQATSTDEISKDVDRLSQIVSESKEIANHLKEESDNILSMSQEGLQVVNSLSKTTGESRVAFEEMFKNIDSIQSSTEKISNASGLIESIASQTNLLSLNASIEAARAGEAGKGFAVVAKEVGNLADQSAETVKEIEDMIEELQSSVENAVKFVGMAQKLMQNQTDSVADTKDKYEAISASVNEISGRIDQINNIGTGMGDFCNEVTQAIVTLSNVSEHNAATTEEISAMAHEILTTTDDFKTGGQKLKEKAKMLEETADKFHI
jgi:methyl-accepting chemotaxis protein